MCNLSDYVEERATKRGMERGIKRGEENKMVELVIGNLRRGRSYEQVADSLMISVSEVKRLERKALAPA